MANYSAGSLKVWFISWRRKLERGKENGVLNTAGIPRVRGLRSDATKKSESRVWSRASLHTVSITPGNAVTYCQPAACDPALFAARPKHEWAISTLSHPVSNDSRDKRIGGGLLS